MEMDESAPATPAEPVLIDAGPEVDQFAKLLDSCLCFKGPLEDKREKLLELPRQYHDVTVKRLRSLFPQPARNGDVDMMDEDDDAAELSREDEVLRASLTKEAQTWDLLSRVLPLRSPGEESTARDSRMRQAADKDDDTLLGPFFRNNSAARERRAVLQWLQNNASYGAPIDDVTRELQHKAERGDLTSNGWLHTRHEIKNKKSLLGWPHLLDRQQASGTMESHNTKNGKPMISQLDPDACARQGRHLQPADAYFEEAIWLGCFELLRRGSSLEEIRSWCLDRTESWRTISMSGLILSRHEEDIADCTSPVSLALWRRMCYALAHKGTSDKHEAAVYGLLSGDISTVEEVAKTWEDYLFAHYNALLRAQIDAYTLDLCPPAEAAHMVQSFPSYNAVQARGDEAQADIQIVHSLSLKEDLKSELEDPYKRLQSAILSRNLDGYFLAQGHGLSSDNCRKGYFHEWQHDGLRMVAHVYALSTLIQIFNAHSSGAFLRNKDADTLATESSIIAVYASFLRRASLEELIPTYCAVLRSQARFDILSENLIMEEDIGRRRTLLTLMEKTGIDVFEFVEGQAAGYYEKVVEAQTKDASELPVFRCLGDGGSSVRVGRGIKADFFGEDEDDIEPNHARLVSSIEWLKLVDGTWPSVLAWGADAYKAFLRNVDLRSARVLMNTVPFASVVSDCLGVPEEEDLFSNEKIEFWKEQLIDIGDADTDPKRVMANARTYRELESLVRALDKIEDISAFVQFATEIEDKPKADQKSFWDEVKTATLATKNSMQPLLNSWLVAGIQGGDAQLQHIRQTYLPETILAYVTALHFAGTGVSREFLLESMNLATIVSDKDGDLEETFVKAKRVRELLEAFTASSKALAMATGEKRAAGSSSKKLRELGWTRDLWSVKL